jgi:diguanylate cyclase (GGDEF)-like protein
VSLAIVVALSSVVQLVAALVAIALVPLTDKRLAWGLIALALLLMTVRRVSALTVLAGLSTASTMDPVQDYVGLALSVCMLMGIALIRPIFVERQRIEEKLRQQATTDDLTGVANRRRFFELAEVELKRAARHNEPLAIAFIDIDRLKDVNDTSGHEAGDRILIAFADTCRKCIREIDVLARLGGDEFALLLPATSCEHAHATVERVRLALNADPVELDGGPAVCVAISAGITGTSGHGDTLDALMRRADHALYEAKGAGRDRAVVDGRPDVTRALPGTGMGTVPD